MIQYFLEMLWQDLKIYSFVDLKFRKLVCINAIRLSGYNDTRKAYLNQCLRIDVCENRYMTLMPWRYLCLCFRNWKSNKEI